MPARRSPGDEATLLREAKVGNLVARQQLLLRQHHVVLELIREELSDRLRAYVDPEDVLQDVYGEILGAFPQFNGEEPTTFRSWSLAIARNRVRELHRRMPRSYRQVMSAPDSQPADRFSRTSTGLVQALEAHLTTVAGRAVRIEALDALAAALALLPEHYRQVIELRYLSGLSVEETSARTGRTKGSVLMIAQRAMRQLAGTLKRFPLLTRT